VGGRTVNLALFKVNLTNHIQKIVRQGGDATRGWLVMNPRNLRRRHCFDRAALAMKLHHDGHFSKPNRSAPAHRHTRHGCGFGPPRRWFGRRPWTGREVWSCSRFGDASSEPPIEGGDI